MLKLVTVALVVVALLSGTGSASAHGKVDQQAIGPEWGTWTIQGARLAQTFQPEASTLSGVSLGLQRMNSYDANVTVNIRAGTQTGPIIASSTVFVPDPAPGQPFDYLTPRMLVHFDFQSDVAVIAGEPYVIQVDADSAGPGWANLGYDAYSEGGASILGHPTVNDFIFQTCGDGDGKHCRSKTMLLDKKPKKSHGPGCIDFDNDAVCPPL